MDNAIRRLVELAHEAGAVSMGNFTLASGKKSHYYFDGRLITMHPEGINLIASCIMRLARKAKCHATGGPAVGAVPIVTAVVAGSSGSLSHSPIFGFMVRQARKNHGTQKIIEGYLEPGQRVALVDDTCSTGAALLQSIEAVEQAGAAVATVIVLMDRQEGGSQEINARGYGFHALLQMDSQGRIEPGTTEEELVTPMEQ